MTVVVTLAATRDFKRRDDRGARRDDRGGREYGNRDFGGRTTAATITGRDGYRSGRGKALLGELCSPEAGYPAPRDRSVA